MHWREYVDNGVIDQQMDICRNSVGTEVFGDAA
jgi:hypothetical protein